MGLPGVRPPDIAIARDCRGSVSSARMSTRQIGLNGKEKPVAEQSSSTVMLRALVMLACLVAIPLAAIFGTSMPEIARKLLATEGSGQPSADHGLLRCSGRHAACGLR